jgi:HME family heavy-metal exporter
MSRFGVTLEQVEQAVRRSNVNGTGGYLDRQGPSELLVRSLGRVTSIVDLETLPVTIRDGRPILLSQVAQVHEGAQIKRGDSSAFVRRDSVDGKPTPVVLPLYLPSINSRARIPAA